MNKPLQHLSHVATWMAWATFACRAVMPGGYMPAAVGEGGPFILCPAGSQAELVQYFDARRGHHPEHHHAGHTADHERHADGFECPIGASFAVAVPVTIPSTAAEPPPSTPPVTGTESPAVTAPSYRYHSRAPPAHRSA